MPTGHNIEKSWSAAERNLPYGWTLLGVEMLAPTAKEPGPRWVASASTLEDVRKHRRTVLVVAPSPYEALDELSLAVMRRGPIQ